MEFDSAFFGAFSASTVVFEPVVDILTGFHPRSRPVLWRMLVAQAYVFCALTRLKYLEAAASEDSPTWKIEEIEAEKLDWRESAVDTDSDLALTQPFLVAKRYLRERLEEHVSFDPDP